MQSLGQLRTVLEDIERLITVPLLQIGGAEFTLWTLVQFLILLIALVYLSRKFRGLLLRRLLPRSRLDISAQQAVAAVTYYLALFLGLLIVLQTVGVNLTTLNVLAGAVGIGVGFGLQNVASNFISGLIILFERPIKIGDRIEVGNVEGDVIEIGARSTTVLTNDNIAIIIPNSKFITENVVNWKYRDPRLRFKVPVSVAYGSDIHVVKSLLLEVAKENGDVLADPPPSVQLLDFGESSLDFVLLVWTDKLVNRKGVLISALNFAIYDKFKEHGIEIPFPQRDLHLRSSEIDLKGIASLAEPITKRARRS